MHTLNVVSAARPKSSQARWIPPGAVYGGPRANRTGDDGTNGHGGHHPRRRGLKDSQAGHASKGPLRPLPTSGWVCCSACHWTRGEEELSGRWLLSSVGRGLNRARARALGRTRVQTLSLAAAPPTRGSTGTSSLLSAPHHPPAHSCTGLTAGGGGSRGWGGRGGVRAFDLGCGQVTFGPTASLGKAYAAQAHWHFRQ